LAVLSADSLPWNSSILESIQESKSSGKPVLALVYADWCPYCKELENNTLPQKTVQKELQGFHLVRLDGEAFPNFKKKYGIEGYPSLLVFNGNLEILGKLVGSPSRDQLLQFLKKAKETSDSQSNSK